MFKNLKKTGVTTKGIFGKCYKGNCFVYINGTLVDEQFQIMAENISLTAAAKLVRNSNNPINGKTFFKKIKLDDLEDQAIQKLTEMGLLDESHQ